MSEREQILAEIHRAVVDQMVVYEDGLIDRAELLEVVLPAVSAGQTASGISSEALEMQVPEATAEVCGFADERPEPRTPFEQLTEAVRRFQSATHSFGCHCDACHRLNDAVAAALTP
jgi:hypothetical protein